MIRIHWFCNYLFEEADEQPGIHSCKQSANNPGLLHAWSETKKQYCYLNISIILPG